MYQSHHDYCKYGPILSVVDVCYLPTTITWFTSGAHENEPMTDVIGPSLAEAYITSGRQEIAPATINYIQVVGRNPALHS